MIAARQELDLRPQLERLDRLICWSKGIEPDALGFAFRPLWQLDEPSKAALALAKAQATAVYAGLGLWPAAVMTKLAEAQLVQDGTYPNAAAMFAKGGVGQSTADAFPVQSGFDPAQPCDPDGRWAAEGGSPSANPIVPVHQINDDPDPTPEEEQEELEEKFKQHEDPQRFFRQGPSPDGIVRVPIMPGGGKSTMAPPTAGVLAEIGTPAATPQAPETAASTLRGIIRGGSNPNQAFHTYRHADEVGLDRARVEDAVRNDLISKFGKPQDGLNQGSVVLDGQKLEYNAFKLPNGEINVGRITISP